MVERTGDAVIINPHCLTHQSVRQSLNQQKDWNTRVSKRTATGRRETEFETHVKAERQMLAGSRLVVSGSATAGAAVVEAFSSAYALHALGEK
jgi:hypothetical protein